MPFRCNDQVDQADSRRWLWPAAVCLALGLAACQFDPGGANYDVDVDDGVDAGPSSPDDGNPGMMPPGPDAACDQGACICELPRLDCGDDGCIDPTTDRKNCGECGKRCKKDETCFDGSCVRFRVRSDCDSCPCEDCNDEDVCDVHHDGSARIVCIEVGGGGD